jgi:hypothetical protein
MRRPPRSRPTARLKVRRPEDLLAVVPYLLGFPPEESLVIVLVAGGRVVLTARQDLPDPSWAADVGVHVADLGRQHHASKVFLIAYSADRDSAEYALGAVMAELEGWFRAEAIVAGGERWWSLTCTEGCCPAEGTPYDVSSHPLAAEAVFAGFGLRANRAELVASVAGPAKQEFARLTALARTVRRELGAQPATTDSLALLRAELGRALAHPGGVTDLDACRLAMLVGDIQVRDVAWATITPEEADEHIAVWQAVVERITPALSSAPLALLGMAAWIGGNGALLNCCTERLARIDPGYSMGRLLDSISERALSPKLWKTLATEIREELALQGPQPRGTHPGRQGW